MNITYSGKEVVNGIINTTTDCYIYPGMTREIKTGVFVKVPEGVMLTAVSYGKLFVHQTMLEGEVILKVTNMGDTNIRLVSGMAVARLAVMYHPVMVPGKVSIKRVTTERLVGGKEV